MRYEQWRLARDKCLTCKYHVIMDDKDQDKPRTIMRCSRHKQRGRTGMMYCIDARTERCGIEAKDWEPYEDQ